MALNASGQISMGGSTTGQSINLELGQSATATIGMNDANVRSLLAIPSGAIALSNAYSKSAVVTGQALYVGNRCTTATYSFIVPAGVTSVSVVAIGAGGYAKGGFTAGKCQCNNTTVYVNGYGGGGGSLGYKNNFAVTPGDQLDMEIGQAGAGYRTSIQNTTNFGYILWLPQSSGPNPGTFFAGGSAAGAVGYAGGGATLVCCGGSGTRIPGGGGGAAGYSGMGGIGADGTSSPQAGTGGSGGGGAGRGDNITGGGGGGGVGVLGQGSNGTAPTAGSAGGGGGGSGGSGGQAGGSPGTFSLGGTYGGGSGGGTLGSGIGNSGGFGAIRIIYPGTTRQFPSTNTGNL